MSDEPTDKQKDRAIAERVGHVWPVERWPSWAERKHNDSHEVGYGAYSVWPKYTQSPPAFVRLMQRLQEMDGVGYSIQSNDISVETIDCATVLYTLGGEVWAQSKAFTGDPMTALRDVVYAWIQSTSDA